MSNRDKEITVAKHLLGLQNQNFLYNHAAQKKQTVGKEITALAE